MTRARSVAMVVVATVCALVLAACSGVPTSTTPQVVRTLNANPAPASITPPPASTKPRDIVTGFLKANASDDTSHSAAQQYLTPTAAQAWKQTAGAVIFDAGAPSLPARDGSVQISGRLVGALSAGGSFTLPSGLATETVSFHLIRTSAGYRITNPPNGLLLRAQDFRSYYHPSPLFFFSTDQRVLVPDLRYSSANGQSLANLLLSQLINGAQGGPLANLPDEFPSQIVIGSTKITIGTPIVVQLPGFSKLAAANRTRIAAELAYTLGYDSAFPGRPIEIQDGATTIPVIAGQETFSQSSATFKPFDPMLSTDGQGVYYVRKGTVYDQGGHTLDDVYGGYETGVSSVAVTTGVSGPVPVQAAMVVSGGRRLLVGNPGSLSAIKLTALATSRPDWTRNGPNEVWLGVGRSLVRVSSNRTVHPVEVSAPGSSALTFRSVNAVRFSPDGTRVALVLGGVGTSASSSAWIGNVVRSAGTVQVQGLYQFTPKGWYVRDIAWTDSMSVDVIDNAPNDSNFRLFSLRSDGSDQQQLVLANEELPGAPQSITAGNQGDTWVSVGTGAASTLWRLLPAGGWQAPFGSSSYLGSAPIYSS